MKLLGIDYGKSKIGLALGLGTFAEPLKVIRVTSLKDAIQKIKKEIEVEKPDKIIVGVSEGKMAEESLKFAGEINAETFDETLSTKEAQWLSLEAGISRKKRKAMEDAYAATIMLQNYLDRV